MENNVKRNGNRCIKKEVDECNIKSGSKTDDVCEDSVVNRVEWRGSGRVRVTIPK